MKTLLFSLTMMIQGLTPGSAIPHVQRDGYTMPVAKQIGRITVAADTEAGFTAAKWYKNEYGDSFTAQFYGVNQLSKEADERIALALETFRWHDAEFFDLVMTSYQIQLAERR